MSVRKVCSFYFDLLTEPRRRYLLRERQDLAPVEGEIFRLRDDPYPLDDEVAAVVRGIAENYVITESWFDHYLAESVYDSFNGGNQGKSDQPKSGSGADVEEPHDAEWSAFSCALWDRERGKQLRCLDESTEDLLIKYDAVHRVARNVIARRRNLRGRFLWMPYFPLGDDILGRLPLIGGTWIDRGALALIEATSRMEMLKYKRLPALDPHPLAWNRFFHRDSRWNDRAIRPVPTAHFENVRREAETALNTLRGETQTFDGRVYHRLNDYAEWPDRRLPHDFKVRYEQECGVIIREWNAWIASQGNGGGAEVAGCRLGLINNPQRLLRGMQYRICKSPLDAITALAKRQETLDSLVASVRSTQPRPAVPSDLSPIQTRIINALQRHPMFGADLAEAVHKDRSRLYGRRGIKELIARGLVCNSRRYGYYLADRPPV